MGSQSKYTQSGRVSSYPVVGLKDKASRRKWYGWLTSLKSLDDLLKPGILAYWEGLSVSQRQKIKYRILDYLGGKRGWEKFKVHLLRIKRERPTAIKIGIKNPKYIAAVNERLSDTTDIVTILPLDEGLVCHVLLLRAGGTPAEIVGETLKISAETVNRIATPEAIASFRDSDVEALVLAGLRKTAWMELCLYVHKHKGELTFKQMISLIRLAWDYEKMRESKRGLPKNITEMADNLKESISKRHKAYIEEEKDKDKDKWYVTDEESYIRSLVEDKG